jgi:hypothetical protein
MTNSNSVSNFISNNKKSIAIGVFVFIVIVIVIIIFSSSSTTPATTPATTIPAASAPPAPPAAPATSVKNSADFFSDCNFKEAKDQTKPNVIYSTITFRNNTEPIRVGDTNIKSYKSNGYKVVLYSNADFTGEVYEDVNNQSEVTCLPKAMRSLIATPI